MDGWRDWMAGWIGWKYQENIRMKMGNGWMDERTEGYIDKCIN